MQTDGCSCISDLAAREYTELQELLKSKYNIDLQLTYFIEEFDLADTVLSGQYDGFISKPWLVYNQAYNQPKDRDLNLKRVADLLDINNNQWLTGIFIVKKDSPLNSMSEINGKVLVAGQQDSYEKYHSPFNMMKKAKIAPSKIINKSSCLENLNLLMDGSADVAVISNYALTASCAVDVAKPEDFRIIGETEQMPLCSVILDMSKVDEADALRLQKALIELSGDNAPAGLISKGFVLPAKWTPVQFSKALINIECCDPLKIWTGENFAIGRTACTLVVEVACRVVSNHLNTASAGQSRYVWAINPECTGCGRETAYKET